MHKHVHAKKHILISSLSWLLAAAHGYKMIFDYLQAASIIGTGLTDEISFFNDRFMLFQFYHQLYQNLVTKKVSLDQNYIHCSV